MSQDRREEEELRELLVRLDSLDLLEESVHQAPPVRLVSLDPSVFLGKKVLLDFVEIMDPRDGREREVSLDPQEVLEIKEIPERTDPQVLMVLPVLLELRDREELWVFLDREESEGWRDYPDQGVLQGKQDLQALPEIKVRRARSGLRELMDPAVIRDLTDLLDPTAHQGKRESLGNGASAGTRGPRDCWGREERLVPPDLLVLQEEQENEEMLVLEDRSDPRVQQGREDFLDPRDPEAIRESWVIMGREDRRDTEDTQVYRDFLDHLARLEIRDLLEFLGQVDKEDLLDQ